MATINTAYGYEGTNDPDSVTVNYFGPVSAGSTYNLFFRVDGAGGDDRLTFKLADYTLTKGSVYGTLAGGTGTDTLELDFAGATSVTSRIESDGSVRYSFKQQDASHSLVGGFTADTSVERIIVKGSDFADVFNGGNGNDYFDGRAGADLYNGSLGNDSYVFDNAGDRVVGEAAAVGGVDSIFSTVTVSLLDNKNVENLRLQGSDAIDATGSELANFITGNAASNVIAGGANNDILWGKGGADTFSFAEFGASNRDTIYDFDADDKISLDGSIFTGLDADADGVLDASAFTVVTRFNGTTTTAGPQIVYNSTSGVLSYDADGVGGQAAQDIAFVGQKLAFFDHADILIA